MDAVRRAQTTTADTAGPIDLPYLLLTLLLVLIGLVVMYSASYARAYVTQGNAAYYFIRQLIYALLGLAVLYGACHLSDLFWQRLAMPLLGVSVVLLILVPIIGASANGATRWIAIGPITFQPSDVTKLAVVLAFASMISRYGEKMKTFRWGILPFGAILVVIAGLLVLEPHLSGTVIILATGASMLFLGGVRLRWFALGGGVVAVFAVVYLTTMGYAGARISAWLDPFSDPSDDGYQIIQSLYAIGSGGLLGLGLGKGRQKYLYLPEEHNDYIFSIVCEELGFVGAVFIIFLFVLLILRGYWIALHARDRFGTLTAAGLTTLLALQVFFNIGVVTNFLPATGIPLPFFSYGGTALVLQLLEVGIVLGVSRHSRAA
jgi:cell division protein FtsW